MVWATGQRLQGGKYVIQGVLGQGGFGITYKALHVSLNHYVVIKTPNEYLQDEPDYHKYVARFIAEAQILARLSRDPHPSIVGVYDLFQEGIISCLVMNFVDGENLFELVRRRGGIPEAEAVRYIRQIGEALTLVHQVGLTHRDAHPGNILLRQNGKAVLIDFGIAKELIPSTYTSTGAVGNEGFAPYEQVHRGSREPNVDVYCLAATLYYTLTGQRPTKSLDRKLYKEPLIPPQRIVPGISKQVNQAILKGMELEPKKRPQSMQAWLKLLEEPRVVTCLQFPQFTGERLFVLKTIRLLGKVLEQQTRKARIIPWVRLTIIAGCYLGLGFLFVMGGAKAEPEPWVMAVAWAGAVTGGVAWARTVPVGVAWAVAGVVAVAVGVGVAWAGAGVVDWDSSDWLAAVFVAGTWAMGVAWGGAVAGAGDGAVNVGVAGVMAVAGVVAVAVDSDRAEAVELALIAAVVVTWAGAVTWAVVGAKKKLRTYQRCSSFFSSRFEFPEFPVSFSKFHTFLILLGTSWLGLGLGWLLGSIL